jgi:uncharacterized phage protein gp47/JayE
MSIFGVIDEGFREKTLDQILGEIEDAEREAFGPAINTQADSVLGQLNGIFADQVAQLWEVAIAVYRSLYPDSASGEALDNVASITGAIRLPTTHSTVLLKLNVDSAVTLLAGRQVSVGSAGALFQTIADVTNGGAVQATIEVEAESVEFGPIVGNAYSLDVIQTPVAGWSAKAAIDNVNTETFFLVNNQTLIVSVDGEADQTVTFLTADFASIIAATAAEVATKINSATADLTATALAGKIRVASDTDGLGSSIQFKGGTANPALGFPQDLVKGFNWNESAKATSVSTENYVLVNNQTLTMKVDGGSAQTAIFLTADFIAIGAAKAREVATRITASITGVRAYDIEGKVRIESLSTGVNSSIEITGGTANTALDFDEVEVVGETHDAIVGRNIETDADFRIRREELLRLAGAGTLESIRSAVRNTTGVTAASVFENPTDTTDVDGLPPHSFEVVTSGGTDEAVAETIFLTKPVGVATHRDPGPDGRTVVVTDSQSFTHDIHFTRPTEIDMWIEIDVTVDFTAFGGGDQAVGEQQVKDILKALGDTLSIGDDAIINKFLCAPFDVTGVIDVTLIKLDDIFVPVGTVNFISAARELLKFSTSRITVNVS